MKRYIVERFIQGLLLVLAVSMLTFSMLYLMPGDAVSMLVDKKATEERKEEVRHEWGLDLPLTQQYIRWLGKAIEFDFGKSISTRTSVGESLMSRIPYSIKLGASALVVEILIGVPLGLLCAYRKNSLLDKTLMGVSLFTMAIPSFWIAVMLILVFGVFLKILPISGYTTPAHYVLPVATLALGGLAQTIRLTKTEVMDVMREKHVQTAYAKGLSTKNVMVRHILRNALILVVVMAFMSIPWIIGGSVILENIFTIPGMGSYLTNAIIAQDFPVVQACVLLISVLTVICNLLCDLVMAVLDPRIKASMSGGAR